MRFLSNKSQLLFIDVQEKLFPHIEDNITLELNLLKLIKGLNLMKIPIIVSEQYKKGLGATIPVLEAELKTHRHDEKNTFSGMDDKEIFEFLMLNRRNQIIICGLEAHICVMQTAIDLVAKGFDVCVIVDGIGSRRNFDKEIAIQRMQKEGVFVSTVESILFELCRDSQNPIFKELSLLVK
jgi:nicotinamidase-related amidase